MVNGTARVLGVERNLFETASDAAVILDHPGSSSVGASSSLDTYRVVNLQVDVPGREPYDATRNGNFFFKRPAAEQVYPVEVSAANPTRFRVLWNKPIPGPVSPIEQ